MKSVVFVIPAALQSTADLAAVAMGNADPGVSTHVIALSATGELPASHYACHSWVSDGWLTMLNAGLSQGVLPGADWQSVGLEAGQVLNMLEQLSMSIKSDGEHGGHFDGAIAALGIRRIEAETLL